MAFHLLAFLKELFRKLGIPKTSFRMKREERIEILKKGSSNERKMRSVDVLLMQEEMIQA